MPQTQIERRRQRDDGMRDQVLEALAQCADVIRVDQVEQRRAVELGRGSTEQTFDLGVLVRDGGVGPKHQQDVVVVRRHRSGQLLQCDRRFEGLISAHSGRPRRGDQA
jgi:hypothetical protein